MFAKIRVNFCQVLELNLFYFQEAEYSDAYIGDEGPFEKNFFARSQYIEASFDVSLFLINCRSLGISDSNLIIKPDVGCLNSRY